MNLIQRLYAYRLRFVQISHFNEVLSSFSALNTDKIKTGKKNKGTWNDRSHDAFAFFEGICYVVAIRFEDGDIWKVDNEKAIKFIAKKMGEFDTDILLEDPE